MESSNGGLLVQFHRRDAEQLTVITWFIFQTGKVDIIAHVLMNTFIHLKDREVILITKREEKVYIIYTQTITKGKSTP